MSGAYLVQGRPGDTIEGLAPLLAAQMAHGGETINHYALHEQTLLGLVAHDTLHLGVMPRYVSDAGLWVLLRGELYESAARDRLRAELPHAQDDVSLLAGACRANLLTDVLPELNGAFFLILYDPADHSVFCANDRYGLYPMYWAAGNGRFCVAERVACSVLAGAAHGRLDPAGMALLLTIDDYIGETTLADGVQVYPQATVLTKSGDTLQWQRYWHYDFTPRDQSGGPDETARELGRRFVESVRRQCKTGRSIGVTLSGGLDSRLIVAAAAQAAIPIQTFTWGKPGAYDRKFAKAVAAHFGADHHDCDYEYRLFETRYGDGCRITEGLFNFFDGHMLAHLHRMAGNVDIILNGYAGDVILGGSFLRKAWMQPLPVNDTAARIFAWRNGLLPEDRLHEALAAELSDEQAPSRRFAERMAALGDMPTPDRVDRFILENRQRRVTAMGTVLLRAAVESAACFFDYDLMDLELSVPAEMRFEHRMYKRVMREQFPDTLALRWQRTLLPAGYPEWMSIPAKAALKTSGMIEKRAGWPRIASRQSPVDFAAWLRGPLKAWIEAVCLDAHPETDNVLRPAFCRRVWTEHLAGHDRTRYLGVIASIRGFGQVLAQARRGEAVRQITPIRVFETQRDTTP